MKKMDAIDDQNKIVGGCEPNKDEADEKVTTLNTDPTDSILLENLKDLIERVKRSSNPSVVIKRKKKDFIIKVEYDESNKELMKIKISDESEKIMSELYSWIFSNTLRLKFQMNQKR